MRRTPLTRALVKFSIALLTALCFSSLSFGGLSAASASASTTGLAMQVSGKLTPAQVGALRAAYQSHTSLSAAQARDLVARTASGSAVSIGSAAYAGTAQAWGNCSYMYLEGYSYGYFYWYNKIHDWLPDGSFGESQFSTNGFTASVTDDWVGGGRDYYLEGNVLWTGWGATGTTMSGWVVLTDGTWCSGSMFAQW